VILRVVHVGRSGPRSRRGISAGKSGLWHHEGRDCTGEGLGERMILNRGMHVDKRPRFNFPTHVRAFISSGDE
jgi:hypothetical protein